jgi:hypothetical protein
MTPREIISFSENWEGRDTEIYEDRERTSERPQIIAKICVRNYGLRRQ